MTEQQPYEVVRQLPGFEVRRYPAHLTAEIDVTGTFQSAGNEAFRPLARYIGGANRTRREIGMTAPVNQEMAGRQILMTAPVLQTTSSRPNGYRVSFVLPADLSEETAPIPDDPRIRITVIPDHLAAAARFSGRWSHERFEQHAATLREAVTAAGLKPTGTIRYARFDPPWRPWFLRRNEVVLPVAMAAEQESPRVRGVTGNGGTA